MEKYLQEFIAFLFFLVVFVWILRNADDFNKVTKGASDVYIGTFKGLTSGA